MNREQMFEIVEREIEQAMQAMFPYGAGRATHTRVRHWLDAISKFAFSQGETCVLMNLLTVEDVAEQFGISPRRVRAIAKNRHERFAIGWQVPGTNQWLFRPEEIDSLTPEKKYRKKFPGS